MSSVIRDPSAPLTRSRHLCPISQFGAPGPPFIELIEGAPGSPWDASQGARFDHLGYWSRDVARGSRRLAEEGMPVEFSGCPYGRPFVYREVDRPAWADWISGAAQ
ncbi:VOC family protein [Yinghuangia aomiensis]